MHCRHFSQLRQYGCYAVMLLLPLISRTILKTFRCIEYDSEDPYSEKQRLLFADQNVNCNSEAYRAMEIYAVANVIIWTIGVPVGLMIWLRSLSIYLDPVGMTEEEAIAVRRTDEHIKSSAVAFLALYHKPRYWYVMNIGGRKESPFCLIAARSILLPLRLLYMNQVLRTHLQSLAAALAHMRRACVRKSRRFHLLYSCCEHHHHRMRA